MNFLSNIFLWLLPLISIPLIIHILNRRKIVQINFSSINFLNSLKHESIKRINILQWLLLLIRMLIILSIILMMSRPILSGYFPQMQTDPLSSLSVILIDDSFSLNGKVDGRNRSEIVNDKYRDILNSLNDNSQICIISISDGVLYEGINSKAPDLLNFISMTNHKGKLSDYISIINRKFNDSIINKEVFIITDGQSSFFDNLSDKNMSDWKIYFAILEQLKYNLKINYAKILNDVIVNGKVADIEVEVENNGISRFENGMVNIFINEINVGLQNITINPGEKEKILFSSTLPKSKDNIIKISISEDDNNLDNHYYINAYIPNNIKVLSIFKDPENMKYVSNVIKTINHENYVFDYSKISHLSLHSIDLNEFDVVIIFDYAIVEFDFHIFEQYLNQDKHLIIFPNKGNSSSQLYGLTSDKTDKDMTYISLSDENYQKVPYSYFVAGGNKKSDQNFIKITKYIDITINSNSLISIGELNSFWDKIDYGNSEVDIFYTLPHLDWSDFPLKGVFLQFIKERLYSGYNSSFYNKVINDKFSFEITSKMNKVNHKNPAGELTSLIPKLGSVESQKFYNPGIHKFLIEDGLMHSVAVNIDQDELSSAILSSEQIEKKINSDCYFFGYNEEISISIINNREGYELWRYLLWLICLLMIGEMAISNVNRET